MRGVIATSDPRASEAGANVLRAGGNAIDAAVAAAFVLLVVEPHACGIGGDAFVLIKRPGCAPEALDGSGAVPAEMASDGERDGFVPIPLIGARTITTPGAVSMLCRALEKWGSVAVADAVAPAIELAREGFEIRPTLASAIGRNLRRLAADPVLSALYLGDGSPLGVGSVVCNPRLADALKLIAAEGPAAMYTGELARAMTTRVAAAGGYLSAADLQQHTTTTMQPASVAFLGTEVWELPPPTQGPAVLRTLELLEADGRYDNEAVAAAMLEGLRYVGIDLLAMQSDGRGDTTYVACIDGDGLGVSLITSVFGDFGSYVGVDALGGPLHNRGAGISLIGQRPRPGKPPHTTIPGLVTIDGELSLAIGVVGGYMQAQGQVQVLINMLHRGMRPQQAIDQPRFRIIPGGRFAAEPGHPVTAGDPVSLSREPGPGGFGSCQIAACRGTVLDGGSDHRRQGAVVLVDSSP